MQRKLADGWREGDTGRGAAPGSDASASLLDGASGATTEAGDDASGDGGASEADGGAPDAEPVALATVHYLGRFDTRDPAGPRFAWPGTAIAATFRGTGIDITLSDSGTSYLAVVIDGGPPTVVATSGNSTTYALAQNLPAGQHTLVLTKRTEANVGVEQLLALTPQGGALVPSPDPFTRRIEYVGDSITCGYGDLGDGPGCSFSAATEDETVAYGGVAATALHAQQSVIAYSGKGMYRDYSGSTTDQMPVLFELALPDDSTSTWGFATPPPDVVVVNLSTNDFAKGDPGMRVRRTRTRRSCISFASTTRTPTWSAPSPRCSETRTAPRPPATSRESCSRSARRATCACRRSQIPADGGSFFGFAAQLASDGYGCDYHPTVKTHTLMGTQLAAALPAIVGW